MDLESIIKAQSSVSQDLIILQKLLFTLNLYQTQLPELQLLRMLIDDLPTPGRNNLPTEALLEILALLSKNQNESEVYRKLYRAIKEELFNQQEKKGHSELASSYLTEAFLRDIQYGRQHPILSKLKKMFG